ncbi:uncharacterized protein LOC143009015 [Genypterus blacodes]|uniref:uncharacterized protein LOC143009015 n=1 Tax=Genypterus blacodes TaxID=154954 RepID=UPI003F76ACBC
MRCCGDMEEEESPGVSSSGDTYDCTVADVTDVFHVEEKTGAQSRFLSRLQKLKAHHDVCERRYEKAHTKRLSDERERTLLFHRSLNTAMEDEIEIPPLTRTDSVFLTKEMLGYKSDLSRSTIASSEDEYVPASSEASSDESSEQSRQKHRPETSSESKGGSAGLSGAKKKKRGREASVHSREEKKKKRYNRSDKRCSRSSEEEDSGESILKTKRRYKKSEKRGTISPVEGEPDHSASIKRKKNRKTYSRHEKSTISISVKTSDSLVIADVPKVDGCKKYHQKRNYCLYCRTPQTKIAHHLERARKGKRKWSAEEVTAVEKSMMEFVRMGKTPGKQD